MNLNKHDTAFLLVRLLALYFFLVAVGSGSLGLFVLTPQPTLELQSSALVLAPFVVWFAASVLLWVFAKPVASLMTHGSSHDDGSSQTVELSELVSLAFPIIGLLVVTDSLPHLLEIITYQATKAPAESQIILKASEKAAVAAALVKLILGLILLLGWRPISSVVMKARKVGTAR